MAPALWLDSTEMHETCSSIVVLRKRHTRKL